MRVCVYFHVAVAVFQKLNIAGILKVPSPVGLMSNPLELAALIVFCFPAFLTVKNKYLCVIPVFGLLLASKALGFLTLWFGMMFYVAVRFGMYLPGIFSLLAVIMVFNLRDYFPLVFYWDGNEMNGLGASIKFRLYVWEKAFGAWLQHPVLAAGIGHWKVVFKKPMLIDGKRWMTVHNEYLQMVFEMGVGFLIILFGYVFETVKKSSRRMAVPLTALVMIGIYSFASFPMHIAPTAIIAVTWVGILTIKQRYENSDTRS